MIIDEEPHVTFTRYSCPVCQGEPRAVGCHHCARYGLTDDVTGWEPGEYEEMPRPPGVMRQPCPDCKFRAGSPELERDAMLVDEGDEHRPFFCHKGMPLVEGHYTPVAEYRPHPAGPSIPLGAMVCAGWWDWATTGRIPLRPYRELNPANTVGPRE